MSIYAEFHVPADGFAFREAFRAEPDMIVEIERTVGADELLTPYLWVSNVSPDEFEAAASEDSTLADVERLEEFDDATLYRTNWTREIHALVHALTAVGAPIVGAQGSDREWTLRIRFDDRECLDAFTQHLDDRGVSFELRQLYEITHPRSGTQYGLTPKQTEAITTAWDMGYFDLPREATMQEVADDLGIAPQSFSDRLRRAEHTLIKNALLVEGPTDHCFSGTTG